MIRPLRRRASWIHHGCSIHARPRGAWWTARVYSPTGALVATVRHTDWPHVQADANALAQLWGAA